MYLLERGPEDLGSAAVPDRAQTTQQLGGKTKSTVQPKRAKQRKPTQSKLDTTPEVATVLQMPRVWPHAIRMSDQSQSRQGSEEFDTCWP